MARSSSVKVGRPTILCFSHLRWNFVWQRPQQLLSRAAASYDVIYFEEPIRGPCSAPKLELQTVMPGVQVAQLHVPHSSPEALVEDEYGRQAGQAAAERRPLLLWFYTPMALRPARGIRADFSIYDCMDDLASFRHAPASMRQNEELLLASVDLVLTGGLSLYQSRRGRHPNVHFFPSSVDTSHFEQARRPGLEPADQSAIPPPRIGYFGVVDERLDLGLIAALATLRRDWNFVFVGPIAKIDPTDLPVGPNIHWLGMKQYADLPSYLRGWSAGFMPFALNDATRYISPTKTPEFLAAGLPVVSAPIKDVQCLYGDVVSIADGPAGFAKALSNAIELPRGSWQAGVDKKLAGQSWDTTWCRIEALLPRQAVATSSPGMSSHVRV